MCQCRCKQGEQGPIGPAGPSFTITNVTMSAKNLVSPADIEIFASAPASGTITFWGQLSIDATDPCEVSMVPNINGSALNIFTSKETTLANKFLSIPISGQAPIVAGQAFKIVATFSAGNGSLDTGNILYSIT